MKIRMLILTALFATVAAITSAAPAAADTACDDMPPGLIGYAPSFYGDPIRLDVQGDYAYLVDWSGSLQIFDISDPCRPQPLGSAQWAPNEFQDVTVEGDIAYVANDADGLALYDVSDPNAPVRVVARKDGGGYADSIVYDGGKYAFVGKLYAWDTELVIYDMTTFPDSDPVFYTPGPGWPHLWEVEVVGDLAYVDVFDGDVSQRLEILDVSVLPAPPVRLSSLALPRTSYGANFSIRVQGDRAYLAFNDGRGLHEGGLAIVNLQDVTTPFVEGKIFIPNAGDMPWKAPGLALGEGAVYMMGADGLYGFDVSNPTAPIQISYYPYPASFGDTSGGDVIIRGDLAITAVRRPEPWSGTDHGGLAIYRLAANEPPAAVADSYVTRYAVMLRAPAPGVLTNDHDPGGRPLTARLVARPEHGWLALEPDGSFVYFPDYGFLGEDRFTYKAINGIRESAETEVSIYVWAHPHATRLMAIFR